MDVCGNSDSSVYVSSPVGHSHQSYLSRFQTFSNWPAALPIKPKDLSEAGFFYCGKGDRTICFSCDLGLKDWESGDDPWIEHALWSPGCSFLKEAKGHNFIVRAKKVKHDKEKESFSSDSGYSSPTEEKQLPFDNIPEKGSNVEEDKEEKKAPETPTSDSELCIICFNDTRAVVFVPCGHFVSCGLCAASFKSCPTCRTEIQGCVRAYL